MSRESSPTYSDLPFTDPPPVEPGLSPEAPPRPSLLDAFRRYWYVVLVPAIVLAAGAVALGLERKPSYTAEAELNVGRVDIGTQAIPGFVEGAQTLADAYSRIADSQAVTDPVARKLRIARVDASNRVTASPVAETTVLRVKTTGDSAADAVTLGQATTKELQGYVARLGTTDSRRSRLLRDYRAASLKAADQQRRLNRIREDNPDGGRPVDQATVDADAARLDKESLGQQYGEARATDSSVAVRVLDQPRTATSDRMKVMQQYAFAGVAGGLLLGAAFAVMLANRRWRKGLDVRR